jgi:ribosomal protein L37AE/L43A
MSLSLEYQDPEFQADAPSKEAANLKAGEICPTCQSAKIDYDSTLNLTCTHCGYTLAGCFT